MKLDYGDFSLSDEPREGVKQYAIDLAKWAKLSKVIREESMADALMSDFLLARQTESLKDKPPEAHVATMIGCVMVLLWLHSEHCSTDHSNEPEAELLPHPDVDTDFTVPDGYPVDLKLIANEVSGAKLFADATVAVFDAERAGTFLLCHIAPIFEGYKAIEATFPDEIDI